MESFLSNIDLHRIFCHFDEDGDGKISPYELRKCMGTVGEELSEDEAEAMVELNDTDGDGLLGFEEFVKLVGDEEEEEEKGKSLREAFRVYEMEGEECITPKSLGSALARLGRPKSMEECEAMVRWFDLNGDGVISFDEFRAMMC